MKTNNTIAACHIIRREADGTLVLNTNQLYTWNIPKRLREKPIQQGDIVLVNTAYGRRTVIVMNVFREEFEEIGKRYKKVVKVVERAPTSSTQQA